MAVTHDGAALFARLNELFDSDPLIDELGLLLIDVNAQDIDSYFQLHEHKLGVAFAAVAPLFAHAYGVYLRARKQMDCLDIDLARVILQSTRTMMLVNADHYSAMNSRKRLICAGLHSCREELLFLSLVFSKHPKAGEGWAHRRWVLKHLIATEHQTISDQMLMESEFRICERVAEIYPKNYFAWSHRQWIVQRVMAPTMAVVPCVESHLQIPSDANLQNTSSFFPELIETWGPLGIELRRLEKWANRHVSDHSGFHQRQIALIECIRLTEHRTLLDRRASLQSCIQIKCGGLCQVCKLIEGELEYLFHLTRAYPGHESLWHHRQFLMEFRINMFVEHFVSDLAALLSQLEVIFSSERKFTLEQVTNVNIERYETNRQYALAYNLWLAEKHQNLLLQLGRDVPQFEILLAASIDFNKNALLAMDRFWPLQQCCWQYKREAMQLKITPEKSA